MAQEVKWVSQDSPADAVALAGRAFGRAIADETLDAAALGAREGTEEMVVPAGMQATGAVSLLLDPLRRTMH